MERRAFLKCLTNVLGALFGFVLGIPSVLYLIDPRNRKAPIRDFRRVARLSDLPIPTADASPTPTQAVIRNSRRDAWTLHPDEVVGRVWLIRRGEKKVDAFTTTCPHLGCSINYEAKASRFVCPCHSATFDFQGQRIEETRTGKKNPAPRGMDRLDVNLVSDGEDTFVEVKYEEFLRGGAERRPKA